MSCEGLLAMCLWCLVGVVAIGGIGLSIGGVGDLFTDCRDAEEDEFCDDTFRTLWWAIFFGVVTMLLTLLMGITRQLGKTRSLLLVIAFTVLSTVDLMDATEYLLKKNDEKFYDKIKGEEDSLRIGTAGLVAMSVANWLIIIVTTLCMADAGAGKGAKGAAPLA